MRVQSVKIDEIAIWSVPPLEHSRRGRLSSKKLSPQRLEMTAGNPPGGRINYSGLHG
jgi:hypothetical protein